MAQPKPYTYVGPRTTVTLPSEKAGDPDESLEFVPGAIVTLTAHQLEQPIISRYLRRNALAPCEPAIAPTARKSTTKKVEAE